MRSYVKAPSFAIVILATLALGIGASTAIFSMVNGILLRPLPLPDPDRLVFANEINANEQTASRRPWPNYLDWRARAHSFETLAARRNDSPQTLTGIDQARRIRARRVTGNFFRAIGVAPALGRDLTDDDDRPNAAPAVIVSDGFWQTHARRRSVDRRPSRDAEPGGLHDRRRACRPVSSICGPTTCSCRWHRSPGRGTCRRRGNHNGFAARRTSQAGRHRRGRRDGSWRRSRPQLEREYPQPTPASAS